MTGNGAQVTTLDVKLNIDRPKDLGRDLHEKISIRNLSFFYEDNEALKRISLPLYERRVTLTQLMAAHR